MTEHTFTEAPASLNLKFTIRGCDSMLTIRDQHGATLLEKLPAILDKLEVLGATFSHQQQPAANGNGHAHDTVAPVCPIHGTPMRPSKKGGGWYCAKKQRDGDWCTIKIPGSA